MQTFKDNVRIGFVFPDGATQDKDTLFPSCDHQTPAYAATLAVSVNESDTILEPAQLTGNVTINLTAGSALKKGERLKVIISSDGSARTVTLGTLFLGPGLTTTASKKHSATYIWNGTNFVADAAWVTLN
jgi:hypothetical protein